MGRPVPWASTDKFCSSSLRPPILVGSNREHREFISAIGQLKDLQGLHLGIPKYSSWCIVGTWMDLLDETKNAASFVSLGSNWFRHLPLK